MTDSPRRLPRPRAGRALAVLIAATGVAGAALVGFDVLGGGFFGGGIGSSLGPPRFVDEAASAGLDFTYGGGPTFDTGGGVAVFDCDGDGRPDVYLAGGGRPAALFRNASPTGGALRFEQVSDPVTDLAQVTGAYPIDLDGDGVTDLAVLRVGGFSLLEGLGGCRFRDATADLGLVGRPTWVTAFSATWEGAATLPTLAVGSYLQLDGSGENTFDCDTSALYRPASGGPGYASAMSLAPGYCTLSVLFSDWDRSGRRDLRVTNDRHYYADGTDQLWRVAPGEPPRLYTTDDGWVPIQLWGMGIATVDLAGTDYPAYYLTSQADNKLQVLRAGPAQPSYRDIALKRGVTAARPFVGDDVLPSTAWHPEFADVNNDGWIDLFVSKGNVSADPGYAQRDPSNLLLGAPDGTFSEAADRAGILNFDKGRGAALVDFNGDGLLDLVEVNVDAPVRLWRNVGSGTAEAPAPLGNWLAIRPVDSGPNRDAIGGWLEVKVGDRLARRELTIGGGHAGGQLGPIHFGLGSGREAQVRVTWPDGTVGPWITVAANQVVEIERRIGLHGSTVWQALATLGKAGEGGSDPDPGTSRPDLAAPR